MGKKANQLTLVTTLNATDLFVASPADGVTDSVAIAASSLIAVGKLHYVLTDAAIKALPTTGLVTLVTCGANEWIKMTSLSVMFTPWVADYGNIDPSCLMNLGLIDGNVFYTPVDNSLLAPGKAIATGSRYGDFFPYTDLSSNMTFITPLITRVKGVSFAFTVDNMGAGNFGGGDSSQNIVFDGTFERIAIPT